MDPTPMLITCHACSSKYSIADHKIRGKSARVQCRRCNTVLEVRWDAAQEASRAPGGRVPARYDFDQDQATLPTPPDTDAGYEHQHAYQEHAYQPPQQEQASPRARSQRQAQRAARRDLFVAPPPPREEVDRREELPPAAPVFTQAFTAGTARNENSVLFTMDSLRPPRVPHITPGGSVPADRPSSREGRDQDGFIDLNAMMQVHGSRSEPLTRDSVRPVVMSPMMSAPPPAHGAPFASGGSARRMARSFGYVLGGLGVAAAIAGLVSLQVVARREADAAAASVPPPVTATVPVPAAPAPPPPRPADTVANAEGVAAATSASAAPAQPRPHGRARKHASTSTSSTTSTQPAKPPPAADPCGCKGNLMCAMKCAAK